jgi:hypothetical protein
MILNPLSKPGQIVMGLLAEKIASLSTDATTDITQHQAILDELQSELDAAGQPYPEWVTRGKSITALIKELGSFEDQSLEVRLTLDGGQSHKPISVLTRRDGYCMLENCEW